MNRIFWLMPRAVMTVMVIWFIVISFFYPMDYFDLGERFLTGVVLILIASVGGFLAWTMYSNVLFRDGVTSAIEGAGEKKEITVRLYSSSDPRKNKVYYPKIPYSLTRLPTSNGSKVLLKTWDGYLKYKEQFPQHAKVFDAVFKVLAHYDYLPATHHEKGHGGASLIRHSMNVVRTMDKLGGMFKYYGLYHGKKLVYPLHEDSSLKAGYYQVPQNDPVLPIIALAHDIGKTVAYKPIDDVKTSKWQCLVKRLNPNYERSTVAVKRVKGSHDLIGKKLILLIPEIYLLTWKDRLDILTAVGYHHHHKKGVMVDNCYLQPLPFTNEISDRQHALAALLDYVDTQTGFLEGGQKIKPFPTPLGAQEKNKTTDSPSPEATLETPFNPVEQSSTVEVVDEDAGIEDGEAIVFKWLCEMIKEESRSKRGNSRLNRLDGWVYLDESHWKTWLFKKGKPVVDQEMLTLKTPGVLHSTTQELLQTFKEKGCLPVDIKQPNYLGLYSASVERAHGDPFIREDVIVFKESALPFSVKLKESNKPIELVFDTPVVEQASEAQPDAKPEEVSKVQAEVIAEPRAAPMQAEQVKPPVTPEKPKAKPNTEALIEWVVLVQNLEFPDVPPFLEVKQNGKTYASVDVLAIPARFIEQGGFGADKRFIMDEETGFILVPIEFRRKVREK